MLQDCVQGVRFPADHGIEDFEQCTFEYIPKSVTVHTPNFKDRTSSFMLFLPPSFYSYFILFTSNSSLFFCLSFSWI